MDNEEEAVKQACFVFMMAYTDGDVEKTLETLSENTPVLIGTAKHEVTIGGQQIRHAMIQVIDLIKKSRENSKRSHKENIKRLVFKQIQIRETVAWCLIIVPPWPNTNVMSTLNEEVRITTVLEKIHNEWKIIHLHASVPDARLAEGEFAPTHSGLQATIEAWLKEFDENLNISHELKMIKLKEYLQKAQEIMAQST